MPQLVAIAATEIALGIAGLTGAAVAVAPIEIALTGALVIGGAVATSALAKSLQPDLPGSGLAQVNAPEVKASVKQSTPAQRIVRGNQRTGGAFAFYKATQGTGKLIVQHMYSRRKWMQVNALNVNNNRLAFATTPFETILSPIALNGQPDYPNKLRVCFQSGTLSQPINPLLRANFDTSVLPDSWRLPGIANAVYEFHYGANWDEFQALWGNSQVPDIQPEGLWCPVHDPRVPSSRLPADPTDIAEWFACQETWPYSDNAALHAADHLWQPDGLNAGPDGVDWDKVAEAADRADEVCGTRDGTFEKRYTLAGVATLDQSVADVFDGMLTASRAVLVQGHDGKAWVSNDAPKSPVLTITDDMILGAVTYRGFKSRHDLANKTVTRFVSPGRDYQESDAPPLVRADLILADGSELPLTVHLPFTPSPSTAQRIAKADLEDARIEYSWTGVIDLRGLGLREDDCVEIASKICPHWNGLYVVDQGTLTLSASGQSGVGLSLVGYAPGNVTDWDPANDDQPFDLTDTTDLQAA